jgi:hypothetical protein
MKRKLKPESEKALRINISMRPYIKRRADMLVDIREEGSFSKLLSSLVQEEYRRKVPAAERERN